MHDTSANYVSPWVDLDLILLSEGVKKLALKELTPHAARWARERCVDRAAWRTLGDAGYLCASIPAEYGGGDGDRRHDAIIAQELARAGATGLGDGVAVSCGIAAHYILNFGTEAQKRRWLPPLASGEAIAAIAMTEPGAGSDLQALRCTALSNGRGYTLSGQKTFISNGQNADLIIVVAKTDPAGGAKGLSLFLVDAASAPGFRRGRNLEKIGMHAQDTSELFFDDVELPRDALLGEREGQGFSQLMRELKWERLATALGAVTSMEMAVAWCLAYVKDRSVFGRSLFDYQNTQFKLAECQTKAVVARTFVDQLMLRYLSGQLDEASAAMAKWWTTDTACQVTDECLQLFGGYGYMAEFPIARLWSDLRVTKIFAGSNEIMKVLIARSMGAR